MSTKNEEARRLGVNGGKARAAAMTPEERSAVAKKGAAARWSPEGRANAKKTKTAQTTARLLPPQYDANMSIPAYFQPGEYFTDRAELIEVIIPLLSSPKMKAMIENFTPEARDDMLAIWREKATEIATQLMDNGWMKVRK